MSLFADYIKEREGKNVIENDHGFASYSINKQTGVCYVQDIYVIPEKRSSGLALQMVNHIVEIAKRDGCKHLMGSVAPSAKNSQNSLRLLIEYGLRLHSSHDNIIFFIKDL